MRFSIRDRVKSRGSEDFTAGNMQGDLLAFHSAIRLFSYSSILSFWHTLTLAFSHSGVSRTFASCFWPVDQAHLRRLSGGVAGPRLWIGAPEAIDAGGVHFGHYAAGSLAEGTLLEY